MAERDCVHEWILCSVSERGLFWCEKCGAFGRRPCETGKIEIELCYRCDSLAAVVWVPQDTLSCASCFKEAFQGSAGAPDKIKVVESGSCP